MNKSLGSDLLFAGVISAGHGACPREVERSTAGTRAPGRAGLTGDHFTRGPAPRPSTPAVRGLARARGGETEEEALIDRYFQIELDPDIRSNRARYASDIRAGLATFLERFRAVFGREALVERLQDLARNSPADAGGKISIEFVEGDQPYNIGAGLPYHVGLGLSTRPRPRDAGPGPRWDVAPGDQDGVRDVTTHEVAHLVFGKFNDAFAESIANLLVASPRYARGPGRPEDMQEMRALAALEAQSRHPEALDEFSLRRMLGNQPMALRDVKARYDALRAGGADVAAATRATRRWIECHAADAPAPWERRPNQTPADLNPNEARGAPRELLCSLGDCYLNLLIDIGGLESAIRFYYEPSEQNLRSAFGLESYEDLEAALLEELRRKYAYLRCDGALSGAWAETIEATARHADYQPEAWKDTSGEPEPIERFFRLIAASPSPGETPGRSAGERPAPPEYLLHPAVARAIADRAPACPDLRIKDYLGEDYDLEKYLSSRRVSDPMSDPRA